jgi:competence protein ComGF
MQQSEKGFTFIEILLVLSLLFLLISFFSNLIMAITNGYHAERVASQQVTMFFNQVAQDARGASDVRIGQSSLVLKRIGQKDIEIKLLESGQVRRTSDGEGNVLLHQHVEHFSCSLFKKVVTCTLIIQGGGQYQKSLFIPYRKLEEEV